MHDLSAMVDQPSSCGQATNRLVRLVEFNSRTTEVRRHIGVEYIKHYLNEDKSKHN